MTATRSERALIRWAMCPASRLMGYACGGPGASEFAPVKIASFHRSVHSVRLSGFVSQNTIVMNADVVFSGAFSCRLLCADAAILPACESPVEKRFRGFRSAKSLERMFRLWSGAEMRVAETRAVNRALRKAYGIGNCSVEEIGSVAGPSPQAQCSKKIPPQPVNGHSKTSGPLVRDRLCQLIRQHQLDPNLVKAYAVDFCGTKALRDATREQVENFVVHLADWAAKEGRKIVTQLHVL
jgi:hypothetical protein